MKTSESTITTGYIEMNEGKLTLENLDIKDINL
jgi:hypothetical protein